MLIVEKLHKMARRQFQKSICISTILCNSIFSYGMLKKNMFILHHPLIPLFPSLLIASTDLQNVKAIYYC